MYFLRTRSMNWPNTDPRIKHIYNNVYQDYRYQAIQSRSDNQMLVEANAFFGKTRTAATTYGLVIPEDSPNSGPDGDFEIDGYMNLGKSEFFCPSSPFLLAWCVRPGDLD
jgi:hypothetical protein